MIHKNAATGLTIGIGGSGGVFAPSLFIGETSGMVFGDVVHHAFGASAGDPALYAVVALSDLKVADAMRPLRTAPAVPPAPGTGADGNGAATAAPDWAAVAGQVTHRADPQSVFATESLAQPLRQLEVYGRDGRSAGQRDERR